MKTKKLVLLALLTGAALVSFVAEAQIPVPVPIPGVKLGLSNALVLLTMYLYGRREAALVLVLKTLLGAVFTGSLLSFLYSGAGALCSFALMAALRGGISDKQLWFLSALGAAGHNLGQLLVAVAVMGTDKLWWYAPLLVLSGIVTGLFTGLCAQMALPRLRKNLP